jgi:hypothetical protein
MNLFLQNNIIIYPKNIYIFYLNLINRLPFSNIGKSFGQKKYLFLIFFS